jgi:ADP-heptose:LPS heptosyltransferase
MIEQLRQQQFDAAVIFTVYSQNPLPSAFLCYMAGIPLRLAHCRENPYQFLTHWVKEVEPDQITRHEVQRQLDLVKSIGADISPTWPAAAADTIPDYSQVIHPGATAASRRYPPESFAIAARQLVVDYGISVVFTGTAPEAPLVESIQQMMGISSHSLVARLELAELVTLLKLVLLLISNNTGPVHIAAAVGTPVVDLYALTNLQHTPPGMSPIVCCSMMFTVVSAIRASVPRNIITACVWFLLMQLWRRRSNC